MSEVTVVTGLWDIGRGDLSEGWARPYAHYLDRLRELMGALRQNLIVFGDASLRAFCIEHRGGAGALHFVERPLEWFRNEHFDSIQAIRTNPDWRAGAAWLPASTQARLEWYNPIVLAKPFLLNDARLLDPFSSTHLVWLDAGITNTVHVGYFAEHDALSAAANFDRVTFAAFPYAAEAEVHGFDYGELCRRAGGPVTHVCRGGCFGGPVEDVAAFNESYYGLLADTLAGGFMGTEESLFSILAKAAPHTYATVPVGADGLLSPFFDALRDGRLAGPRVALYVLTFNSPSQLQRLFSSLEGCDPDFVTAPDRFVIDNSNDGVSEGAYAKTCERYGAKRISLDNIGINGGRQFAADHAHAGDYDYHFFFEDDMTLVGPGATPCRNGFARYVPGLYRKALGVCERGGFDFVKLSFSEFYGDNHAQWAFFNLPADYRAAHWPEVAVPVQAQAHDLLPRTRFSAIESHRGLAYARGEVYYANWPQVVSRSGNERMFQATRFENPYEQTWMSHFYQEAAAGRLRCGVLLLSPVEHDRFDHYGEGLRREN